NIEVCRAAARHMLGRGDWSDDVSLGNQIGPRPLGLEAEHEWPGLHVAADLAAGNCATAVHEDIAVEQHAAARVDADIATGPVVDRRLRPRRAGERGKDYSQ